VKKISGFDLGVIIAFSVITLLGAGAWYYLSGELQSAQADDAAAKQTFDQYSTKYNIVVSHSNGKTLQGNIDLLKAQLDPLIHNTLKPKDDKLHAIEKEDPVAWKHDLDDEVRRLTDAARLNSVTLPANFYFGFSRYQSQSPNDEQTAVLSKQLLGVEQLATILIKAPVRSIDALRRSYEEDPHVGVASSKGQLQADQVADYSLTAAGDAYKTYPFEIDFNTTPENLRSVIDKLLQSPNIFVVRSMVIENSVPNSPMVSDLDRLAGPPPPPMTDGSPGDVAAAPLTKGPQFLFGNSMLNIKVRIDMIEWMTDVTATIGGTGPAGTQKNPPSGGIR
jgi:hypothetical protein